ncbi:MAG TPA: SDR family oxidoreductase [Rhizomicrobium sp.]|jgi:NAD(P)-dependent dehydrogenase (short-subunit alcohol dehydrogenase family)|nr:SDR family oxidoreductase [Rhizomicrobium sp.]
MKNVVVTGASTGIGWGCARVLIDKGFRVFGSVRKPADGERLSREFGANFTPLLFDVTDSTAVRAAADQVQRELGGETLDGLVNNAGIAVAGPLLYIDPDEVRRQLEVNVVGQVLVTQAFAPLLAKRDGKGGRIVMISSVGGRSASPFMGPYNASKFAIEGLSESLRRELMLLGIDVIIVAPGAVATPIWDKAEEIDISRYDNTPYAKSLHGVRDYMLVNGRKGLKPEVLGRAVWHALTTPNPRTRYTVTPDPFQNFLMTTLPKRIVDRMIAKRLGW